VYSILDLITDSDSLNTVERKEEAMSSNKKNSDHQNAEVLTGSAIPQNPAEKSAAMDHKVETIVTGKDPIPSTPPDWAKDLPTPKKR
jgi:hypothetical protein